MASSPRQGPAGVTEPARRSTRRAGCCACRRSAPECDDRDRRRSARRLAAAGFPREKWLADFDYQANPNVQPAVIAALATCEWVRKGEPLCLIEPVARTRMILVVAQLLGLLDGQGARMWCRGRAPDHSCNRLDRRLRNR